MTKQLALTVQDWYRPGNLKARIGNMLGFPVARIGTYLRREPKLPSEDCEVAVEDQFLLHSQLSSAVRIEHSDLVLAGLVIRQRSA